MKAFLFHCWGGDSRSCWGGWLADTLRQKGITVIAPDFPSTDNPKLEEWLAEARKQVPAFDDSWVLIGHSLGCPAILRLLEDFGQEERVGAAILVAGFAKDLEIPQIKNFVDKKFDWPKIRKSCRRFFVINSDNDPYIPIDEGQRLADNLGADLIVEHGGGHINEGSGYASYPLLLKIVEESGL